MVVGINAGAFGAPAQTRPAAFGATQQGGGQGAAASWIGAPSWSLANGKWRDYYNGLSQPQNAAPNRSELVGALSGLLGGYGHSHIHNGGSFLHASHNPAGVFIAYHALGLGGGHRYIPAADLWRQAAMVGA